MHFTQLCLQELLCIYVDLTTSDFIENRDYIHYGKPGNSLLSDTENGEASIDRKFAYHQIIVNSVII